MDVVKALAYSWRATNDGIGHAIDPADATRTMCKKRPVLERLAWPTRQRCLDCTARITDRER